MSPRLEQLALELLIWRSRRLEDIQHWPAGSEFGRSFANHCAVRHRAWHFDDLKAAVDGFAEQHATLVHWYDALLAPFARTLCFEGGAPRLRLGALAKWRAMTARIDPDALVALRLADQSRRDADAGEIVRALPAWKYSLTMADHGLETVLSAGVADTHIHFEASDPMPLLWLRLCQGLVRVCELQLYSDAALAQLKRDQPTSERRKEERRWLEEACEDRSRLVSDARYRLDSPPTSPDSDLREERAMLVWSWQKARFEPDDGDHLSRLDRYLFVKNLFLYRHQQSANQGPGLTRFRDFLDRGETIGERRSKRTRPRVRQQRFDRMLSLATEAECLRSLELRITPQKSLAGWQSIFRLWRDRFAPNCSVRSGTPSKDGPPIRFVVHFIRNADASPVDSCPMHFGGLRRMLDRQSAVLQLFRHRHPELAAHIVGIDVANLERGCGPELFAPYLQLLRGDDTLAGALDVPALKSWRRLKDRALHRPPIHLPRLGITYHAGEDFHHPVDGMRAMWGLATNLLHPGDRIGHGLAVGIDVERFQRSREQVGMPQGVLLDNLVWLRREARNLGVWTGEPQSLGDRAIGNLSHNIYGRTEPTEVFERALDARFKMPRRVSSAAPPEQQLVFEESDDKTIWSKRALIARAELSEALFKAVPVVREIQAAVIRMLRNQGISVEANPTSNLITGAIDDFVDHPFFRYMDVLDGQVIVSINTDDPGVFGTRIDVEYALIFEAMIGKGIDRHRALEIIDRSRCVAINYAFE